MKEFTVYDEAGREAYMTRADPASRTISIDYKVLDSMKDINGIRGDIYSAILLGMEHIIRETGKPEFKTIYNGPHIPADNAVQKVMKAVANAYRESIR